MSPSLSLQETAAPPLALDVTSETALLRQVIVHTPGEEMELVSPENRLDLLFDDILFVRQARKEHLRLCAIFEKIIGDGRGVLQIATLLQEAFEAEDARHAFVEALCRADREQNLQVLEGELKRLAPAELHDFALTGRSPLPIHARPLPNLLFMRDVGAVFGDHVILSHPATAARARESVILDVVLHYHPRFAPHRDRIIRLPPGVTFEGGDLLVASPEVALIGHSERTSFEGVMAVAQALFGRTSVQHVLMVNLPKQRSCMHLDTVFTFATPDECVVFPPLVEGGEAGRVVRFSRGDAPERFTTEVQPGLKHALGEVLGRSAHLHPLRRHRPPSTSGASSGPTAPTSSPWRRASSSATRGTGGRPR